MFIIARNRTENRVGVLNHSELTPYWDSFEEIYGTFKSWKDGHEKLMEVSKKMLYSPIDPKLELSATGKETIQYIESFKNYYTASIERR